MEKGGMDARRLGKSSCEYAMSKAYDDSLVIIKEDMQF